MLTPQSPKNRAALKPKELYFVLNPQKWVEHEEALKFLEGIARGQGVHTVVAALNFYAESLRKGGSDASNAEMNKRLKTIQETLDEMRKKAGEKS